MSGPLAGAVMTTFFAPAARCFAAASRFGEQPGRLEHDVDAEVLPRQLRRIAQRQHLELVAVDGDARRLRPRPSRAGCRAPSRTSAGARACAALVRSLTATKSMFLSPSAARMMLRPMRPNPLMPTFTAIALLSRARRSAGQTYSLMNALAEGQTVRYTLRNPQPRFSAMYLALQPADAGRLRRRLAVLPVPGDPLQEIHRQPAAAPRLPADLVQPRRRGVDLDSRGVGRRGADRARAGRRSARRAIRACACSCRRRRSPGSRWRGAACSDVDARLLLSVRLDVHRPPHARAW